MRRMVPTGLWLAWLIASYLSGSIPFGLLIGLSRGVDIRKHGSGNVGATNVGRTLGKKWGILCFALDVAKGLAPVLAYSLTTRDNVSDAVGNPMLAALQWLAVAAAAMLGHVFPVWLGFRGGKGVATGLGVLLGVWPILTIPALLAGVVWFVTVKLTGYVSLASIVAAAALPVLALGSTLYHGMSAGEVAVFVGITAVLAGLVVVRHRGNIAKLRAGTESRAAWAKRA